MPSAESSAAAPSAVAASPPSFRSAHAALTHLKQQHGQPSAQFLYTGGDGKLAGLVIHWERESLASILARQGLGKVATRTSSNSPLARTPSSSPLARGRSTHVEQIARRGTVWTLGEMLPPRPLYRWKSLAGEPRVVVARDEPTVERLRQIGIPATCCPPGDDSPAAVDWQPLAGKEVVLLSGESEQTQAWADAVAHHLTDPETNIACTVRIEPSPQLELPADEASDEFDFDDDFDEDDFDDEDFEADQHQPAREQPAAEIRPAVDFDQTDVPWLWPGRIALGKLTLLAGDPGMGKSLVTLDIAARTTANWAWPDAHVGTGWQPVPTGDVIILSAEDDPQDTICPRLQAAGAYMERVHILEHIWSAPEASGRRRPLRFSVKHDLDRLAEIIVGMQTCKLVIIDPVAAFLGRADLHRHAAMTQLLGELAALAQATRVAVLAVTHLNKRGGGPAIYRSMGSLAFAASARSVWLITKDAADPGGAGRLLVAAKNNLAHDQNALAFQIIAPPPCTVPMIQWDKRSTFPTDADGAMNARKPSPNYSALAEASEWLSEMLAQGPVPVYKIKRQSQRDGIAWRTLRRAKDNLQVRSFREDGKRMEDRPWVWELSHAREIA